MAGSTLLLDSRWNFDFVAFVGKQLTFTIALQDEDGVAVDLTGYTAAGKIVDEDNTTVLDLSPTVSAANGHYIVDLEVPGATVAGRYDWKGLFVEADGDEHVRFYGKVTLETY